MTRFFGKPTKFVRHMTDENLTIEPQRVQIFQFWKMDADVSAYVDGQDVETKTIRLGSRVTKYHVDMTVQPETIEPQRLYMGIIKLSFHDIFSPFISKIQPSTSAWGTATTAFAVTGYIPLGAFSDSTAFTVTNYASADVDIGDIQGVKLDDNFKHWIPRLKKIIVFDQNPLISSRFMKVPSKVKRGNHFTFYGLWIFNDSIRGATPADTQVKINIKQYLEEWAI